MYNTGNPVPSSALEDMADNAQTFDALVTKTEGTTTDRLGRTRRVFQQILMDMGFQPLSGSFKTGATVTARNQCLQDTSTGTFYSWSGVIPEGGYVVPAGSTPATAGGVGALLWVGRTDIILQANLAASTGAGLVGTTDGITVQAKLNAIAADKANTSDVNAALALKANTSDLATKADTSDLATKADTATVISRTKKGGLTTTVAGGAMTLTQAKRLFSFRNSTMTNGAAVEVTPAADMTFTVPNGASLGAVSGVPAEYLEILLYNGGSPVVGIVNAACGLNLDESGLISSSAISASETSATTIYSSDAVTNSPYIILNRLSVTLPTAGEWSVLPTVKPVELQSTAIKSNVILLPAIATTSGASIPLGSIPSWAKKITVQMVGVSTSATSALLIKLGVGGVAKSATYNSSGFYSGQFTAATTGFYAGYRGAAAGTVDGAITLTKQSYLSWAAQGYTHSANGGSVGGSCTLTGVVDSLFLTTVNGTDTFDAGSVSLLIEG